MNFAKSNGRAITAIHLTSCRCGAASPKRPLVESASFLRGDGSGFPLAIDLHSVLLGSEKAGDLIATSTTVKRGGKLIVVRTEVKGETDRLLIDMTTTHLRAGK